MAQGQGAISPATASADGAGAPQAGTTATSASTASAASAAYTSSTATAARAPVDLQDAIDAVRASFTVAVRQGQSQAQITLSPASLGAIRISLSQTPDGLIARVAADHPEALQLLQQNSAELRNSLQASGLHLLRLDIGSGDRDGEHAGVSDNAASGHGTAGGQAKDSSDESSAKDAIPNTPISSSAGSLVDILA